MIKQFDVVVVGGGAVGASVALALGQCHQNVLLIEKKTITPRGATDWINEKTLALSYGSAKIYEALGLKALFCEKSVMIKHVHVNQQGQFGSCRLNHKEQGVEALGYVVNAYDLEEALYQALEACPFVKIQRSVSELEYSLLHDKWQIGDVEAKLLIACDGAHSVLRQANFIPCDETDYNHGAIGVNMQMKKSHNGVALERFLQEGAIALLPWRENWMTCVWTLSKEEASKMMQLDDDAFKSHCQAALGNQYGTVQTLAKRTMTPLHMKVAKCSSGARFLLMGNAAHSLHPIAAQGLNLSLRDVWQLRSQLRQNQGECDPGAPAFLAEYERARQSDQARVIFATDKIASIMASQRLPASWRAMGITLFDSLSFLKSPFTRVSMGVTG